MIDRFVYWLGNEPNAPATFVQAVSAIVTVGITALLCFMNYEFMKLTRETAKAAVEQMRASLRPVISVRLRFVGGRDQLGGEVFKDSVEITVANRGSIPVVVKKVFVEWDHSDTGEPNGREEEVFTFRRLLLHADHDKSERFRLAVDGTTPTVEHFEPWSDWVTVTVHCSDIGDASPIAYRYRDATGLEVLDADETI